MTTTATRTGATNQVTNTFGKTAPRIRTRINMRATRATSAAAAVATRDLVIVKETMKMIVEEATGTGTDLAIVPAVTPGGDTGTLAGTISERSPAMKQGAISVPLVLLLSASHRLGIPSVDIPDGPEVQASAPGNPEVPALVLETLASAQDPEAVLVLGVPA